MRYHLEIKGIRARYGTIEAYKGDLKQHAKNCAVSLKKGNLDGKLDCQLIETDTRKVLATYKLSELRE